MNLIRNASLLVALTLGILAPNSRADIVNDTYMGGFPANISGTLANQGTALEEMFTLTAPTDLVAYTTSYASGGFEPNLTLYDASGMYITTGVTPGSSPVAMTDPTTGLALDAYLTAPGLAPGTYTLTLTDFLLNQSITATNLSDGFTQNYGNGVDFIDEAGNVRNGNYALTIVAGSPGAVPEPATAWLTAPFLAALALLARRRLAGTKA